MLLKTTTVLFAQGTLESKSWQQHGYAMGARLFSKNSDIESTFVKISEPPSFQQAWAFWNQQGHAPFQSFFIIFTHYSTISCLLPQLLHTYTYSRVLTTKLDKNKLKQGKSWVWYLQIPENVKHFFWLLDYKSIPTNIFRCQQHLSSDFSCFRCEKLKKL